MPQNDYASVNQIKVFLIHRIKFDDHSSVDRKVIVNYTIKFENTLNNIPWNLGITIDFPLAVSNYCVPALRSGYLIYFSFEGHNRRASPDQNGFAFVTIGGSKYREFRLSSRFNTREEALKTLVDVDKQISNKLSVLFKRSKEEILVPFVKRQIGNSNVYAYSSLATAKDKKYVLTMCYLPFSNKESRCEKGFRCARKMLRGTEAGKEYDKAFERFGGYSVEILEELPDNKRYSVVPLITEVSPDVDKTTLQDNSRRQIEDLFDSIQEKYDLAMKQYAKETVEHKEVVISGNTFGKFSLEESFVYNEVQDNWTVNIHDFYVPSKIVYDDLFLDELVSKLPSSTDNFSAWSVEEHKMIKGVDCVEITSTIPDVPTIEIAKEKAEYNVKRVSNYIAEIARQKALEEER